MIYRIKPIWYHPRRGYNGYWYPYAYYGPVPVLRVVSRVLILFGIFWEVHYQLFYPIVSHVDVTYYYVAAMILPMIHHNEMTRTTELFVTYPGAGIGCQRYPHFVGGLFHCLHP